MADYCQSCKKTVHPVRRDFGIGAYEFWGDRGTHHDWRIVCAYCETETTEEPEPAEED